MDIEMCPHRSHNVPKEDMTTIIDARGQKRHLCKNCKLIININRERVKRERKAQLMAGHG